VEKIPSGKPKEEPNNEKKVITFKVNFDNILSLLEIKFNTSEKFKKDLYEFLKIEKKDPIILFLDKTWDFEKNGEKYSIKSCLSAEINKNLYFFNIFTDDFSVFNPISEQNKNYLMSGIFNIYKKGYSNFFYINLTRSEEKNPLLVETLKDETSDNLGILFKVETDNDENIPESLSNVCEIKKFKLQNLINEQYEETMNKTVYSMWADYKDVNFDFEINFPHINKNSEGISSFETNYILNILDFIDICLMRDNWEKKILDKLTTLDSSMIKTTEEDEVDENEIDEDKAEKDKVDEDEFIDDEDDPDDGDETDEKPVVAKNSRKNKKIKGLNSIDEKKSRRRI
jgi:hypothetical protein